MKPVFWAAGIACVCLTILFYSAKRSSATSTAPPSERSEKQKQKAPDAPLTADSARPEGRLQIPATHQMEKVEESLFYIEGRCIAPDLAPISEARAAVYLFGVGSAQVLETRTDSNGAFLLRLPKLQQARPGQLKIEFSKSGWTTRRKFMAFPEADNSVMLPPSILYPASRLEGLAIDQWGSPLPGLRVLLAATNPANSDGLSPDNISMAGATTDSSGKFILGDEIRTGKWTLSIRGKGAQSWNPREVTISTNAPQQVIITVDTLPPISGQLEFEGQIPKGLNVIATGLESQTRTALPAMVSTDGSFKIVPNANSEQTVRLSAEGAPDYLISEIVAKWGDDNVRVQLQQKPSIKLTVLEMPGEKPLLDYGISLSQPGTPFGYRRIMPDESGQSDIAIERQPPTEVDRWMYVIPRKGLAPCGPFQVQTGLTQLEVHVWPAKRIQATVRSSDSRSIANAKVSILGTKWGGPYTNSRPVIPGHAPAFINTSEPVIRWDSAKTDDDGHCQLNLPELNGWQLVLHVAHKENGEFSIPIKPSKDLYLLEYPKINVARFVASGSWPNTSKLHMRSRSNSPINRIPGVGGVTLDRPGTINLGGVPKGDWDVVVSIKGFESKVAEITIPQQTQSPMEIRADKFVSKAALVQIFNRGKLVEEESLRLTLSDQSGNLQSLRLPIVAGKCAIPSLLNGRYIASINGSPESIELTFNGSSEQSDLFF